MSKFLSSKYKNLKPYTPGEQPKDMKYIKLNTNESPFPPSENAMKLAYDELKHLNLYPDPECRKLTQMVADKYGVSYEQVLMTNGSDEILNFAFMAYCDSNSGAVFPDITYGFYKVFADLYNIEHTEIPLKEDFTINISDYFNCGKTVFIANPNAPTGIALSLKEIEEIIVNNSNNIVVIDEAYVDFGNESAIGLVDQYDNLLVTRTFSKSFSMAGSRLGFGIGSKSLIDDLNAIKYSTNPYNINRVTMASGIGALIDYDYTVSNCLEIIKARDYTVSRLEALGFECTPSTANFVFAKHNEINGYELYSALRQKGILVRHFDKDRIREYNRITIGTMSQMEILINTLKEIMEEI